MKGYEVINRLLAGAGVETVFQYMAEDTMELMSDLVNNWDDQIEVVHSRHEQGAMAMADAYARAGDEIGVCVVGRGPGVAQTGTALLNASKNGTPLLVVAPTPADDDPLDRKVFEQDMYLQSTAGDVTTIRSEETLVPMFREALRRTYLGEGTIAVQIPKDLLNGEVDVGDALEDVPPLAEATAADGGAVSAGRRSSPVGPLAPGRLEPDSGAVEEAVERYLDSDAYTPPVILAGEGAYRADAKEAIEALAERLNAIIVTSLKGRDYFHDHPYAPGFIGNWGDTLSNEFMTEANYVLAVGASMNDKTVDEGYLLADDATVIQVDHDPSAIGDYTPVDLGIVGDAKLAVEALDEAFAAEGIDRGDDLWTDDLAERIAEFSAIDGPDFPEKEGKMDPREATRRLEDLLPQERLVGTDGGQFRKWVLDGITAGPADSIISCDFSAIGLGLPMGVGIGQFLETRRRSGTDDRTAITFCGDGGFMMSLQELETAVRHEIPLVAVVINDSSLGAEYHQMATRGQDPSVALLDTPQIADVAEAMGAEGHVARSLEDLEEIASAWDEPPEGPIVVECIVDHEVRHRSY